MSIRGSRISKCNGSCTKSNWRCWKNIILYEFILSYCWRINISTPTITKNKFIQDNISSTSSIAFGTTTIAFTYSGASNTQSGVTITKTLSCDNGITVYNPNITAA